MKPPPSIWTTLLRVNRISGEVAYCVISAWNPNVVFPLRLNRMDMAALSLLLSETTKFPARFITYANLAAEHPKDLKPHYFEVAPEPDMNVLRACAEPT